tara:strand:- start:639 stop:4052 length:3414 start_codon:yes stop_codon:yes gene_type:complete
VLKDYNYYTKEDMNKEVLSQDEDFITDARKFLTERGSSSPDDMQSSGDVYDAFMEHFRYQDVNEVTAIRDYEYAQNGTQDQRANFGRVMDVYDNMADEKMSMRKVGDYFGGIVSAPSTIAGILTGGAGKLASVAGQQGIKFGLRTILSQSLKGGLKAGAVEGAIGTIQGAAQEGTRVETGLQETFTGRRTLATGLGSAVIGGGIGGVTSGLLTPSAIKAAQRLERIQNVDVTKAAEAKVKTDEVLKNASKEDLDSVQQALKSLKPEAKVKKTKGKKGKLDPLDEIEVTSGKNIRKSLSESDTLTASIPAELFQNISAAAIQIRNKIKPQKGERITTAIARSLRNEEIVSTDITKILDEHNLSSEQFSLMYLSEVSDAGRTLQASGQVSKSVQTLLRDVDELGEEGLASVTGKEMEQITKKPSIMGKTLDYVNPFGGIGRNIDQLRLGVMTSQPATAMRNTENAGFRVIVDAFSRSFDNALNLRNPFSGTFDVAKFLMNPYEAQVVKQIFKKDFPDAAGRLFRDMADIEVSTGAGSGLQKIGIKLNVMNTLSDNIFKRAVFVSSLRRNINDLNKSDATKKLILTDAHKETIIKGRLKQKLGDDYRTSPDYTATVKSLSLDKQKFHTLETILESGNFKLLPDDILKKSIQDAFEFTYQATPKGDNFFGQLGKGVISLHKAVPFVISSLLPFPRYVANQLKFVYEHTPLIGMLPLDKLRLGIESRAAKGAKAYDWRDRTSKQLTGAILFTAAYAWRAKQGNTNRWYEMTDSQGNTIDGRPLYGPFAPFMLAADILYRTQVGQFIYDKTKGTVLEHDKPIEGTLPTFSFKRYGTDIAQALLGSTFRTGMGLYALDKLWTDASSGSGDAWKKVAGEFVGNIGNTFMLPVSVVKDFYSQYDEKSRYIPESKTGDTNFLDIVYHRALRAAPDFPIVDWTGDGPYERPLRTPFVTGDIKAVAPLEKQMFGMTKRAPKNKFQKEIANLNMEEREIYKRPNDQMLDLYMSEILSQEGGQGNLNEKMAEFIDSTKYKDLDKQGTKIKRVRFKQRAQEIIDEVREIAREKIENEARKSGENYSRLSVKEWSRTQTLFKDAVNEEYRKKYKGKSIDADREKFIIVNGRPMNILNYGLEIAKALGSKAGEL